MVKLKTWMFALGGAVLGIALSFTLAEGWRLWVTAIAGLLLIAYAIKDVKNPMEGKLEGFWQKRTPLQKFLILILAISLLLNFVTCRYADWPAGICKHIGSAKNIGYKSAIRGLEKTWTKEGGNLQFRKDAWDQAYFNFYRNIRMDPKIRKYAARKLFAKHRKSGLTWPRFLFGPTWDASRGKVPIG